MSTEIAPLQSVQDNIKNKIKAEFANLIPDEMWGAMVKSVIAEFTTDQIRDQYGHSNFKASPMKQMIRAEIETLAKDALKQELDRLSAGSWGVYGEKVAAEAIKKMIADNFPAILASIQAGFVEQAVMTTVSHMRNSMNRI